MFKMNKAQSEAVKGIGVPMLVLAGAGSGKTRVITEKIAYLINKCGYAPDSITAVTFTNKAAREMKQRVNKTLGEESSSGLNVSTFHTLGLRIISSEIASLPYRRGFSIFDSEDSINLVKEILKEKKLPIDFADNLRWQISKWKNALVDHKQALKMATNTVEKQFAEVFADYDKYLQVYNAVDFDDLISAPCYLFKENPEILDRWQNKIRYLLVDEYQDTNGCQYQLVKMLVGIRAAFTVVGDDDQSIYSWRGAQPENLRLLLRDFPSLKVVKLEQNYRSYARILKLANTLIGENPHVFDKKLWSDRGYGDPVQVIRCKDQDDEVLRVVTEISNKKFLKKAKNSDFAILFRSNHQIRLFERALRSRQLPYKLSGSFSFFALAEVKDLMSYLKLIINRNDDSSFTRIINTPRREIGLKTISAIREYAAKRKISFFKAISEQAMRDTVTPNAASKLEQFSSWINSIAERAKTAKGEVILKDVISETGYHRWISANAKDKVMAARRRENVNDLVEWVESIKTETGDTLADKVAHLSLMDMLEKNEDEDNSDRINLMTLHASKGLEFSHVFMVGMEEGILPHRASIDEDESVEEERRLAYVGITRAEHNLTITYAARRRIAGDIIECIPSRFLFELPQDDLEWFGKGGKKDPAESKEKGRAHIAGLMSMLNEKN